MMCPDNLSVWEAHECSEAKREAWEEAHLPVCDLCGKKIDGIDDWFCIDDYHYHKDCFSDEYSMDKERYFSSFR